MMSILMSLAIITCMDYKSPYFQNYCDVYVFEESNQEPRYEETTIN
jgi:hypothetical protein